MGNRCDVCGEQLGLFRKFKYADGYICKTCYAKASRQFTETVREKSLAEIKSLCMVERDEESFENFIVTGKIGNYLLFDDKNKKICITSNRMTNQRVADPSFYDVADIKECNIKYDPFIPFEELQLLAKQQKSEKTISYLKVELKFYNGKKKEIILLANPVRIRSFAFRQSLNFAQRIQEAIWRLMGEIEKQDNEKVI